MRLIKAAQRRWQAILVALSEALGNLPATLLNVTLLLFHFAAKRGSYRVAPPNVYQRDMLQKSRDSGHLFRIPERWRRRLQMRLTYSLASVSHHTIHYQVTFWTSKRLEMRLYLIWSYILCLNLPLSAIVLGKDFLTVKRMNVIKSKKCNCRQGAKLCQIMKRYLYCKALLFWAHIMFTVHRLGLVTLPKPWNLNLKILVMFRRMLTKSTS